MRHNHIITPKAPCHYKKIKCIYVILAHNIGISIAGVAFNNLLSFSDGTTDVTRTVVFEPHKDNVFLRKCYTLVLKVGSNYFEYLKYVNVAGAHTFGTTTIPIWQLWYAIGHINTHVLMAIGLGFRTRHWSWCWSFFECARR